MGSDGQNTPPGDIPGWTSVTMSLRVKLGLYVVVFVSALLLAVGMLQTAVERDLLVGEWEGRGMTLLSSFAIPCAVAMANNDMPTLDNYVVKFAELSRDMELDFLAVLDFDGRVVAHTRASEFGKVYTDAFTAKALAATLPISETEPDSGDSPSMLRVAVPVVSGLRWGTVTAGFALTKMELQISRLRKRNWLTSIGVALAAAVLAFWSLSMLVAQPVSRMSEMARRFGSGRLDARVHLSQRDEMGQLAMQLNGMAEQVQRYTGSLEKLVDERTAELAKTNHQLVTANKELERLARTDPLTGLYNRRHFMEQLLFEIRRGQRNPHEFTVIMMDVDRFKHYNDTNGHTEGDELLQRLSALLEINLRATDVVARYGGEEFIVLLLDTPPEEGLATAVKLQQVVAAQPLPHQEKQPSGNLTISVGVSFFPADGQDAMTLIERADQALYSSKENGRNQVTAYSAAVSRLRAPRS